MPRPEITARHGTVLFKRQLDAALDYLENLSGGNSSVTSYSVTNGDDIIVPISGDDVSLIVTNDFDGAGLSVTVSVDGGETYLTTDKYISNYLARSFDGSNDNNSIGLFVTGVTPKVGTVRFVGMQLDAPAMYYFLSSSTDTTHHMGYIDKSSAVTHLKCDVTQTTPTAGTIYVIQR